MFLRIDFSISFLTGHKVLEMFSNIFYYIGYTIITENYHLQIQQKLSKTKYKYK